MNKPIRLPGLLIIVVLFAVMASVHIAWAEPSRACHLNVPHAAELPLWVVAPQEYPTTSLYGLPSWVLDRQQYETTYIHVPSAEESQRSASASSIPQWVRDRQQYEPSYVYVPAASETEVSARRC